ncbi:MAG: FAD-dependent oxidoreductase [Burkholderiaceae bacterium]
MSRSKLILILAVLGLVAAFFAFDGGQYLSLAYLKSRQAELAALYGSHPWTVVGVFFGAYVLVAAFSLPGAIPMTLAAGAFFGLITGTILVSFASSLGATLAFLASRYVLRDAVPQRFRPMLADINKGIEREGAFYLFTMRLIPFIPFFAINLLMGLTRMKAGVFYLISQLGMLAGTMVYVNAGTQLARIDSLQGILSPALLGSFVLLGVFPLIAKKIIETVKQRKVYAPWLDQKPATFDRNLVVIGAGAAGLVSSYIAAAVKAKVTLVEGHKMGGDCLNYGCVPSKALIKTASLLHHMQHSEKYGIQEAKATVNFADVMERVARVVREVEPHDSVERYTKLGVDVVQGQAMIVNPWRVDITLPNGQVQSLSTKNIIIATGAAPFVPPLPGLNDVGYLTSDTLWGLRELPKRLVVLGGGPIGCELAQCFARLGAEVTQIEMAPRIMVREDEDVSVLAQAALAADGVQVLTEHKALRCEREGEGVNQRRFIVVEAGGVEKKIEFDQLLCAVGRSARLQGFGLEKLGVPVGRTVQVNDYLQTNFPNIYAAGDVAGPFQFTHTAAHQAWYASVNALFGSLKKFKADYSVIPWATFIAPEVARVGLNEQDAKAQGVAYEVTRYGLDDLDRAIADSAAHGFAKVLTVPGKDKILGVTIVGEHAGDLLAEFVLAMKHGLGLNKILGTIHTYPTWAEANKYAAGEWKRAHQPKKLLEWVARFHAWQRG